MKLNYAEYNRRVNDWIVVRGYSDILKAIVINLTTTHSDNRIRHEELWNMLKDHG